MNGKERILKTFDFEKTDRIPFFEQAVASSIMSEFLGRQSLGFTTDLHFHEANALYRGESAYNDFVEQFKHDYKEFALKIDVDMVSCPWFLWGKPSEKINEFTYKYENENGWVIRTFDASSQTFGEMESSLDSEGADGVLKIVKNLAKADPKKCISENYYTYLQWLIDTFGAERCVAGGSAIAIPMHPAWWVMLLEDPGVVCEYLDFITEVELSLAERQSAMGIRVINGGGDLANNKGPVYSPAVFREMMLPRLKKTISKFRENGGHYIFRTDGNIWSVSDMLFNEAGADAYGEIDIEVGMTFPEIRKRYPRVALWGGLPCGSVLMKNTEEEITRYAENLCQSMMPISGWIAGSSNSVLHGTNLKGYLKAIELIKSFKI